MTKNTLFYAGIGALLALTGCRKDPLNNLTSEESRVYITNRDASAQFSSYSTYSLVDSIAVISASGQSKQRTSADADLLNTIETEMNKRGYRRVERTENPDLGLSVSKIDVSITSIVPDYYPGYWSMYDAYWDPFYWGYGGYNYFFPTFYNVFNTQVSSISIDMIDLENAATSNNQLKVIWNAQLEGDNILAPAAARLAVVSAFDQSAYLGTNP